MNVLLIGIDYFAQRGSGDKNFWYQMMPILRANLEQLFVISFNYRTSPRETQTTPAGAVHVFNVRPAHIGVDLKADPSTIHNKYKCHAHFKTPPRGTLEYVWTFLRLRPRFLQLIAEQRITNVHCMDNFGPAMKLLRRWTAPVPVSASAMSYYARRPLHDRYTQWSFQGLDRIVPYSPAICQKLIGLGLPRERLQTIRWGVEPEAVGGPVSLDEQRVLKLELGVGATDTLVFWTGFIQQIQERELLASLEIAHKVVRGRENVHFIFALKPECFKISYQALAAPRISVLATSNDTFLKLLRAADFLLSPITNAKSIVTPPLTWIEAMAVGVPVITNQLSGVDAIVSSGETGFVAENLDAVPALVDMALSYERKQQMREKARAHILAHYTVAQSAMGYQTLWRELGDG